MLTRPTTHQVQAGPSVSVRVELLRCHESLGGVVCCIRVLCGVRREKRDVGEARVQL